MRIKMVFEIVEKNAGVVGVGDFEISIGKTGAFFGSSVADGFDGFERCEIYLDYDNRQVGFKPSNDNMKGFKINKAKDGKQRKAISGTWTKKVAKGRYVATKDDVSGLWVINVTEIARGSSLLTEALL